MLNPEFLRSNWGFEIWFANFSTFSPLLSQSVRPVLDRLLGRVMVDTVAVTADMVGVIAAQAGTAIPAATTITQAEDTVTSGGTVTIIITVVITGLTWQRAIYTDGRIGRISRRMPILIHITGVLTMATTAMATTRS